MATMVEQIFAEISHLCRNDECAHLAAALVTKLVEEKFTSTNSQSDVIALLRRWVGVANDLDIYKQISPSLISETKELLQTSLPQKSGTNAP